MTRTILAAVAVSMTCAACAGRPPAPVAVVQPMDQNLDCPAIVAEVQANDAKLAVLGKEDGEKVAQNVIMGTVGAVLFFPALFLMDFQNAAGKEIVALQQRQNYLATVAAQKNCAGRPVAAG